MIAVMDKLLSYEHLCRISSGTFVETGSGAGEGIQRALNAGFNRIHSIEASPYWFSKCAKRFAQEFAVRMHEGRSVDILPTLELPIRSVFYLDAHPSGPSTAGHDDLMKNGAQSEWTQDKTIKAELAIILVKFDNPVIVIDDQQGENPWSQAYATLIEDAYPSTSFAFYDENIRTFYHSKLLVAIT